MTPDSGLEPQAVARSIKGVLFVDGQVVLVRNPRDEWELPGGRPDGAESPQATLVREFREELGLAIAAVAPIDHYDFEVVPGRTVHIVTYGCALSGTYVPHLGEEHTEVRLFAPERLPAEGLPAGYRKSIAAWSGWTGPGNLDRGSRSNPGHPSGSPP